VSEDLLGRSGELPYPLARTAGIDLFRLAKGKHDVPVLLEIDVTAARAAVRRHTQEGDDLSFTAWVMKCVAQAAGEYRRVHALRQGHRKLVVFEDVDMALAVYRRLADDETDERLPMPFVLRKANEKSVATISAEVRRAQSLPLAPGEQWLESKGFAPPPRSRGGKRRAARHPERHRPLRSRGRRRRAGRPVHKTPDPAHGDGLRAVMRAGARGHGASCPTAAARTAEACRASQAAVGPAPRLGGVPARLHGNGLPCPG
jgi:hypothetical protein